MKKLIIIFLCVFFLQSCAGNTLKKEKKYFFSKGFALVYEVEFYEQKIINKKINNEELIVIHSSLKTNRIHQSLEINFLDVLKVFEYHTYTLQIFLLSKVHIYLRI